MAKTKETSILIPQLCMFLIFFGFTLNINAIHLMILHKTCLVSGHEEAVCTNTHEHPDVEDEIQAKVQTLTPKLIMLIFMPAAFMTLILGPLSDMYGRKKILAIPVVTGTIATVCFLVQSQVQEISLALLYGACAIIGLGGGLGTFVSTLISYVTDSTPPEHRTERLSLLLPMLALGQTISTLCSGIIWEQAGAFVMFVLTFISNIIIIISLLFLEESQTGSDDDKDHGRTFSFQVLLRNATAGWRVVTAPRQNGGRRRLLMLLIIGPAAVFFNTGKDLFKLYW